MVWAEVGADSTDQIEPIDCSCESSKDCCDSKACAAADCCGRWYALPQDCCGINIHGWVNGGFIWNTEHPDSAFNGPYNAVDRANEGMLNQVYLVAEKALPACGTGIGARLDVMYGEDYLLNQSIGLETRPDGTARWNSEYYGVAMPQAYVSVGNQDASLQVGHYYTLDGYEDPEATVNFFYSRSYSYQFAGPFTHWGARLNYRLNDAWLVQAGMHNGWDALDRVSDDIGVTGKIRYDDCATGIWSSLAVTTGKEYNDLSGQAMTEDFTNRTRYTWLVNVPVTCRLTYVFNHWLGFQEEGAEDGDRADWYGIDQYLYYTINCRWQAGLRFEWFRDEEGTRVGLNRPSNLNNPPFAGDFYSLTFGFNWTPTENLRLRPEIRADWYDGDAPQLPFNDGTDDNQLMVGLDAILLF
jgi:hypothetical protein